MTVSTRRPALTVYNPDVLSRDDLIAQFVARRPLLERLLDDLRRSDGSRGSQHHLIVGQRGMGKTTLLRRLRYAIDDDVDLSNRWLTLIFPEEQYNVARLSDLWVNCLDALGDSLQERGERDAAASLDELIDRLPDDEDARAAMALRHLNDWAAERELGLILTIDNIDLVLERLGDADWAIREALSTGRLVLVGASANALESTYRYEGSFYDFFQVHELAGLSDEGAEELLRTLATLRQTPHVTRLLDDDPGRLRALNVLTGGNPRTLVLLFNVLAEEHGGDIRGNLESLLDHCTPLYKARFESLAPQLRQLVDTLALNWDPMTAADLAAHRNVRMDINAVSAQLNRLSKLGVVSKTSLPPGSKTGFMVAERFFNIWYLMRASRRLRRRLIWLVEFLRLFYGPAELRARATSLLTERSNWGDERRAEMAMAYAQSVDDPALSRALETRGVLLLMSPGASARKRLVELFDLDGEDSALKPIVDRMKALSTIRAAFRSLETEDGIDSEELCELLLGSPSLYLSEKMAIAASLGERQEPQLTEMKRAFVEEKERSIADNGPSWTRLSEALRVGLLSEVTDFVDLDAAALKMSEPRLRVVGRTVAAGLYLAVKRYDLAESILRSAIHVDPQSAETWNHLANLMSAYLGRYEEAEQAYRLAIELDPILPHPWNGLGILLADFKARYDEAEQAYRKAVELAPYLPHAWNGLGNLLSDHLERYDEAEQAFRKAIELAPQLPHPWHGLGKLLRGHLGRFEEAEQAFRKAIQLARHASESGRRFENLHVLATILAARGEWTEALELAREFLGQVDYVHGPLQEVIRFAAIAARNDHAAQLATLFEELDLHERQRPLHQALLVVAEKSADRLLRLAPEVRQPTEEVVRRLLDAEQADALLTPAPSLRRRRR